MGCAPTGRRQEVDEVYILRVKGERVVDFWGWKTTGPGCSSSGS
jgi:hypothetical protein